MLQFNAENIWCFTVYYIYIDVANVNVMSYISLGENIERKTHRTYVHFIILSVGSLFREHS